MNTTENQNDPYAQLQPEYLRSLCGGYEPHCINWTREMLPDGYRPLAKAEVIQNGVDEVYYEGATPKWHKCSSPEGTSAMPTMQHRRTKRPVEYRIAPDPAQTYHTPNVVQQCREEAAAINAAMNPAPAGKLTDEQLVEIGAKAGLATGEHSTYYKAFARAVREAVEAKQAEEIARLTAELAGQKAQSAKALGMALDLNLNLQNKADMWRDEFERIKAIEFSKHGVVESEIAGICDRAMSDIRSKISLIDQREKVADENGGLCVQLAKAGAEIATLTTRFEKEQQASAAATKQFEEYRAKFFQAKSRAESKHGCWMQELAKATTFEQENNRLTAELAKANAELERLQDWKDQQMAIDGQWDPQKVGRILGMTAGQDIRRNIEPKIVEMLAKLAAAEKRLDEIAKLPDRWKQDAGVLSWKPSMRLVDELEKALRPEPTPEELNRAEFETIWQTFPDKNNLSYDTAGGSKAKEAAFHFWQAARAKEAK